jgi:hypothetical protein
VVTDKGSTTITALLAARKADVNQLTKQILGFHHGMGTWTNIVQVAKNVQIF